MNLLRKIGILCLSMLILSCQSGEKVSEPDPSQAMFEKNSATVLSYLNDWQSENLDHDAYYASDFMSWDTGFGGPDSLTLADWKEGDAANWARFDFEMVDPPFNLLPGVDVETKKMDGSVRYYGDWKVTSPASDSTEEKSGIIRIYSAFVFNEEGKIITQLTFGDFGGLMGHLLSAK